ncbi:MAG: rod shape-determining protein MreD [Lachnospiraceae bacterium]|nr:rod shape-determining protein MreD [Lachnospiraceae bacterium]
MLVRGLFYTIAIIISFLLQTSVFSFLKLAGTAPNVMLAFVVCIAMIRGRKEGTVVGFFCGLLVDLFYGTTLGPYALLYVAIGYVNGYFHKLYFQDDFMLPLAVLIGNSLIYDILVYIFFFLLRGRFGFFYFLWSIIIPEAIYTAIVAFCVYVVLLPILIRIEAYEERGTI